MHHFCVHPFKLAVSLTTCVFSAAIGLSLIGLGRWGSSLLFFAIVALFLVVALTFGATITLDREGVRRSIFGRVTAQLAWNQIAEVGVTGTKVFNQDNPKKTGSLYIYFSPVSMAEEERFQMALSWPPKDKIFLLHTKERMDAVQLLWNGKIQTHNTGELHF